MNIYTVLKRHLCTPNCTIVVLMRSSQHNYLIISFILVSIVVGSCALLLKKSNIETNRSSKFYVIVIFTFFLTWLTSIPYIYTEQFLLKYSNLFWSQKCQWVFLHILWKFRIFVYFSVELYYSFIDTVIVS